MNGLEPTIAQTMIERSERIDSVRFTPDDVFRAGKAARSRQRRTGVAAVGAAVVSVVIVAVSMLAGPGERAQPPVPPAATTGPVPTTASPTAAAEPPRPTGGVPASSVKLNIAVGTTITPWDGPDLEVALPASFRIWSGVRVPGGWVLHASSETTDDAEAPDVWWLPNGGTPQPVGHAWGGWVVSRDGRTLVVAHSDTDVSAYHLPSLAKFAGTAFVGGIGPAVVGVAGDWVLLIEASGDGTPTRAGVWNTRTGVVTRTTAELQLWGMSNDGNVLRRVVGSKQSCLDVVPVTALDDDLTGGLCSASVTGMDLRGSLSPDGAGIAFGRFGERALLLRGADVHNGQWQPIATGIDGNLGGWDTATTLLGTTSDERFLRCAAAACTPVALPDLGVAILPNYGS